MSDVSDTIRRSVEVLYRTESRRVLATLIRLLGDFDLAEEALHEAFSAALAQWGAEGLPGNPRAWLVSTGRFKAIDMLRRRARFDAVLVEAAERLALAAQEPPAIDDDVGDDRLRLIFTCCHPALSLDGQIALTLREVCGLTTEAIAHAFLVSAPTIAQRIVRAKAKIRDARIPYDVPPLGELPSRLDAVLRVIYLLFNEGYLASSGGSVTRADLSTEAIRLGRLLVTLIDEPEATGLLALMLLHDARRAARVSADGELVLLEDQDRTRWDRVQIEEGTDLVERSLRSRRVGPFAIQAAIAALHGEATTPAATDWPQIVGLYDVLMRLDPTPIVALNRAVAVAMRDDLETGLALVESLLAKGDLDEYHLVHSARAELCRRLGRFDAARDSYTRALALVKQAPERRFLERRLSACRQANHEETMSAGRS